MPLYIHWNDYNSNNKLRIKDVEQLKPLYTAGGNGGWCNHWQLFR
jgi:hypothetical protein